MTTVAAISAAVTATAMIVTATTTATMAGVKFLFRGIAYELDHTYVMQIFTGSRVIEIHQNFVVCNF